MISLIVMASGMSKRFGENKLLFKAFNGMPIVENILLKLSDRAFRGDERLLVCRDEEVRQMGRKYGFTIIDNSKYREGKSASVKAGVRASDSKNRGLMFFVGDQPFISIETISRIKDKGIEENKIVVPLYTDDSGKERRGNPVYFPSRFKEDLLKLEGDDGGSIVIRSNLDEVLFYRVGDSSEFFDIDRKSDLEKIKGELR